LLQIVICVTFVRAHTILDIYQREGSSALFKEKLWRSRGIAVSLCNQKKEIKMASNSDFVQYIADQCSGAGEITVKKMFGDYGIYCDGKIFGLICDDCFYLKPTEEVRPLMRVVDMRPPYEGAKNYFYIADVDDRDYLSLIVRETCKVLPEPKPKKKKR
jgi:TfoX/Sxy family transcriptional regulator of competence genes